MSFPNECIIVGGGSSLKQADFSILQPLLASKFTILTNYSFKHFKGTFLTFQDRDFYKPRPDEEGELPNPDIYEELKELPLIVGINQTGVEEFKLDNTILLDKSEREILTGVFALKLALWLMKSGTIFLLGFDFPRRIGLSEKDPNYNPKTNLNIHYYDIKHRGSGYVGYYENHNADKLFNKFVGNEDKIKIYNVNLKSNINCFEKINYEHMYTLLNKEITNQEEIRIKIKHQLQ
jgi:hypothetical protein